MSESEFSLIEKYFSNPSRKLLQPDTILGIGDDAAVIKVPAGHQLVVTMDTLVAGRHFPLQTSPYDIAYKSLAVNVSDLVAMAATPSFFLLSITLPEADEDFLVEFSAGLFAAANAFSIALVGGDTCKGDLSVSIQASGFVADSSFVSRSGARVGDRIFVSGTLGAAALGLASVENRVQLTPEQQQFCVDALNRPFPRLDLIDLLRQYATAAIDLSDGLLGDLGHILSRSQVGAKIDKHKIPAYPALQQYDRFEYGLSGGDDYQILFTVAEENLDAFNSRAEEQELELFEIGVITESGYFMQDKHTSIDLSNRRGFDHFAT